MVHARNMTSIKLSRIKKEIERKRNGERDQKERKQQKDKRKDVAVIATSSIDACI